MYHKYSLIFAVLLLVSPLQALAAPFCVTVQGIPPQCIYDDTQSCKIDAVKRLGICTINTKEITGSYGTEKFCIVDSSRVPQCIYIDRSSCEAAQINGSVCVNNTFTNVNDTQPDPFAEDPNRNY